MEYSLPQKENNITNEILYVVTGKKIELDDKKIIISNNSNANSKQFLTICEDIIRSFNAIESTEDIVGFIKKYGNIYKENEINIDEFIEESKVYNILLKLIDIINVKESAQIVMDNISKLDFNLLYEHIKKYMESINKIEEYEKKNSWKKIDYNSGDAIKKLKVYSKNKYKIEKDAGGEEIVFACQIGIPIDEIIIDIYHVINALFASVISKVRFDLMFDDVNRKFRRYINVGTLLEAIYLYTYNTLAAEVPLRNCHNHKCSKVIMSQNINKLYCSDKCRSVANKRKSSLNSIDKITNAYKQAVYRYYDKGIITAEEQEKTYSQINNMKKQLEKKEITINDVFETEYEKILRQNNISLKRRKRNECSNIC